MVLMVEVSGTKGRLVSIKESVIPSYYDVKFKVYEGDEVSDNSTVTTYDINNVLANDISITVDGEQDEE